MAKKYMSLQGEASFADLDVNNNPKGFKKFGNAPKFDLALSVEEVKNYESTSGQRLLDAILYKTKDGSIDAEFMEIIADNLALLLNGTIQTIAGGSVASGSPEVQAAGVLANEFIYTKNPNISAVTVKDSAGSPVTLVNNTDYKITDAASGEIQILNLGTFVQPFKLSYTYSGYSQITMFDNVSREVAIRVKGINTHNNKKVSVVFHRAKVSPVSGLSLINDEFAKMPAKIALLADDTKQADPILGQFGRFIYVDDINS